jgi:DNA-binding transcriptional LysR family regulator
MPYFLSGFIDQHPGIDLEMDVTNKTKVIESLERNEIDLALVSILPANLRVEKLDLLQNKLFLVGNASSRIRRKKNTRELLSTLPLIFREKGSGTRQVMESFIERNKIQVKKKIELTSNEAVKQAVLAGLGYSVMPLIGIRNELHNQELQLMPVKGLPITTTWRLIWLRGKNHSPVTESFLQYLQSNKNAIIQKAFHWYEQYA